MSDADEVRPRRKPAGSPKPNRSYEGGPLKKKKRKRPVQEEDDSGSRIFWLVSAGVGLLVVLLVVGVICFRPGTIAQLQTQVNAAKAAVAERSDPEPNGQPTTDGGRITIHTAKFRGMDGRQPQAEIVENGKVTTFVLDVPTADLPRWAAMKPGVEFKVREMLVGKLYTREPRGVANGEASEAIIDWETAECNPGAPMDQTPFTPDATGQIRRRSLKITFVPETRRMIPKLAADALPAPDPQWQRALATLDPSVP